HPLCAGEPSGSPALIMSPLAARSPFRNCPGGRNIESPPRSLPPGENLTTSSGRKTTHGSGEIVPLPTLSALRRAVGDRRTARLSGGSPLSACRAHDPAAAAFQRRQGSRR